MVRRPAVSFSLATSGLLMASGFILIPNIAPYVQQNLSYPRENMSFLYFVGGLASFASMLIFGRLTDRLGPLLVGVFGCLAFFLAVILGFVFPSKGVPVPAFFSLFMIASALRGVSFNTLSSKVPGPHERARYMSVQSSVQHFSSAIGATLSSVVLALVSGSQVSALGPVLSGGRLHGIEMLGWLAIGLNFIMVFTLFMTQRSLHSVTDGTPAYQEAKLAAWSSKKDVS